MEFGIARDPGKTEYQLAWILGFLSILFSVFLGGHVQTLRCLVALVSLSCAASVVHSQQLVPSSSFDFSAPGAQSGATPNPPLSATPSPSPSALANGDVSLKTLPFEILRDQKYVWLFPISLARGQHLFPALAIVGVTAGLMQADPPAMRYFGRTTDFNRFDESFNGSVTGAFEGLVPASLYVFGLARHDSYAEKTALLAGEAYADSAIPHLAIKIVSRRIRPNAVPPGSDYSHTFFRSSVTPFGKGSSFPSGHAAAAFSIATVIARRYRDHGWVPWLAYGVATVFAFARAPARAHYPSDIFLGAALGYAIARYDTLRPE